jgi:signal transduction histidine kinase
VTVDVHDDGTRPAGRPDTGRGLAGMRERAAVYAGQVSAGPDPSGGWRVRANLALPIEAAAGEAVASGGAR